MELKEPNCWLLYFPLDNWLKAPEWHYLPSLPHIPAPRKFLQFRHTGGKSDSEAEKKSFPGTGTLKHPACVRPKLLVKATLPAHQRQWGWAHLFPSGAINFIQHRKRGQWNTLQPTLRGFLHFISLSLNSYPHVLRCTQHTSTHIFSSCCFLYK